MTRIYGKKLKEELLKQDFYPHVQSNGVAIAVSADGRYYYNYPD